jgi:hypothetical protein
MPVSDACKITAFLIYKNGFARIDRKTSARKVAQNNSGMVAGIIEVSNTTHVAIPRGNITTNGVCFFANLENTDKRIQIGPEDSTGTFLPLLALTSGMPMVGGLSVENNPYAKAPDGLAQLEYYILED